MPRPDAPLSVELPGPGADRPAWGKVGIIAAVGFLLGILWPRLTSTRIAPHPPNDNATAAAAAASAASTGSGASGGASGEPSAPAARAPVSASASAPPPPAASAGGPVDSRISVGPGAIVSCRDGNEDPNDDCGSLEFDPIALPRIKALVQCPGGSGAAGKLSIGFDVDFQRKAVRVLAGKSSTMPRDKADALVKCAEASFDRTGLREIPHKHRRYTVFYAANFASTGKTGEPTNEKPVQEGPVTGTTTSETPASGMATVAWDVVLVRDVPKTGGVVGRVLRGSKVKVLSRQGEWYKIEFGATVGWVYRGTIGL